MSTLHSSTVSEMGHSLENVIKFSPIITGMCWTHTCSVGLGGYSSKCFDDHGDHCRLQSPRGGVSHFDLRVQTGYRCSFKLCRLLGHDVPCTLLPASILPPAVMCWSAPEASLHNLHRGPYLVCSKAVLAPPWGASPCCLLVELFPAAGRVSWYQPALNVAAIHAMLVFPW